MKAIFYDPTTGRKIGRTGLRRDIVPGYLRARGWRAGSYRGEPALRNDNPRGYAAEARAAWRDLRYWIELTGWRVRVETTQAEARALLTHGLAPTGGGTYWMRHTGSRVEVTA